MSQTDAKPLPLADHDFPIVLEIVDGSADTSIAHIPAARRELGKGGAVVIAFADYDAPPSSWQSACGIDGWVYNRGGPLANITICHDCAEAAA